MGETDNAAGENAKANRNHDVHKYVWKGRTPGSAGFRRATFPVLKARHQTHNGGSAYIRTKTLPNTTYEDIYPTRRDSGKDPASLPRPQLMGGREGREGREGRGGMPRD